MLVAAVSIGTQQEVEMLHRAQEDAGGLMDGNSSRSGFMGLLLVSSKVIGLYL